MSMGNLVVFKGSLDGITVIIDEGAPFEEVLKDFEIKLENSKKFFEGVRVNMRFKGRALSKEQQEELMALLKKQNIINVSFVHAFEQNDTAKKADAMEWVMEELLKPNVSLTHFHYGMVRSGQHLSYKGSVVVLGDVNPGGEVTADGNVIIVGTLNGKVHAGKDQAVKTPFVLAINMHPLQISIGDVVAQSPEGEIVSRKKNQLPQIAYVSNNHIYVEEIDVKTMLHMVE
ncbi:MAG: septum site-determining protein MinC [Cellulosilyticaceae bacterium]